MNLNLALRALSILLACVTNGKLLQNSGLKITSFLSKQTSQIDDVLAYLSLIYKHLDKYFI